MDDTAFWNVMLRALIMMERAIKRRYPDAVKMKADDVEEPPKAPRYLRSH